MARCIRFEDVAINAMYEAVERFHETEILFSRLDAYCNLVMKRMRNECCEMITPIGFSREGRRSFFARYEQYFSPLKNEIGYRGMKLREGVLESDLQVLRGRITVGLSDFLSDVAMLSVLEGR